MEPESVEEIADEYLPPYVFARLGNGVRRLGRRSFRQPTNWGYVAQSLLLAVLYVKFSPWVARHVPRQYSGASRWIAQIQFSLYDAAKHDLHRFFLLAAAWGLYSVVAGPLYEELTFRGLPILAGRAVLRRSTGVPARIAVFAIAAVACIMFAWMHFRRWDYFPVPQFLFGVVAWCVAWRRGLRYSVIMHMTTNLLFFAVQIEWVLAWAG